MTRVSCIMPTAHRREFVPKAIAYYQAQTWPERELIVFDDGDSPIRDLVPHDPTIKYFARRRGMPERSIGELRNLCCDLAGGDVISHWDDDDWHAPEQLAEQVEFIERTGADLVGYSQMYFFDIRDRKAWLYKGEPDYVIGTSFLYRRQFWHSHQFLPKVLGEDNSFREGAKASTAPNLAPPRCMARIHGRCTSPKPVFNEDAWAEVTGPETYAMIAGVLG